MANKNSAVAFIGPYEHRTTCSDWWIFAFVRSPRCKVKQRVLTWGLFLEDPEKFSHPKSLNKISNLVIAKLFSTHILNMNRSSLHRSFRRIHFSVFKHRLTKNGFSGRKSFRGFRETGPWAQIFRSICIATAPTATFLAKGYD